MSEEKQSLLIKTEHSDNNRVSNINNSSSRGDGGGGGSSSNTYGSTLPTEHTNYNSSIIASEIDDSTPNIYSAFPPDQMKSTLSFFNKIGFGLGHVHNDLCAGVWFSYTLLFMQGVLSIPSALAGALVMLGQIGDALATPVIGFLADRYGTKRKWHMIGTALIFCSFPLIFSICPYCGIFPFWWQPTYFAITILLFQFGWAIVQISHLAIIPEMSKTQKDRADLTAIRYSASVCSNVVVYIVTWAILHARKKINNTIGPSDAFRFRDIALILTLIGISMSVCFQFSLSLSGYNIRRQQAMAHQVATGKRRNSITGRKRRNSNLIEKGNDDGATEHLITASEPECIDGGGVGRDDRIDNSNVTTTIVSQSPNTEQSYQRKNFFKTPLLYQNAFLYVFSRLFMTTALIYMPLWLDERSWTPMLPPTSEQMNPLWPPKIHIISDTNFNDDSHSIEHIATVPLVSFLASFLSSMALKYTNQYVGHQIEYLIGSITSIIVCTWVALAVSPSASTISLYGIAILFGIGSSITMISSLCITADMIGAHADQSGFIYSAVTFADKLITGIVIVVIEALKCQEREECPEYYRNVLAYACGTSAILGLLTLTTLQFNRRRHQPRRTSQQQL